MQFSVIFLRKVKISDNLLYWCGVNLTRALSLVMIALILASLAGYLTVTASTTMTFANTKNSFQLIEKTSSQELLTKPSHVYPCGDPIDDPKPNTK
jgi:hypothetical protein